MKFKSEINSHDDISNSGLFTFANKRAVIIQQHAFKNLRASLFEQLGQEISHSVLYRFGYKNARDDYQRFAKKFSKFDEKSLLFLGPRLHTGMGHTKVVPEELDYCREQGKFLFRGRWLNSYEAEAHLEKYGISRKPVCFSLCGYGSGWCSEFFGQPVLEVETQCKAQGHDYCKWEIRPLKDWGNKARPWIKAASYSQKSVYREWMKSKSELMQLNKSLTIKVADRTKKLETLMRILCHDLKEPVFRLEHKLIDQKHVREDVQEIKKLLFSIQTRNQYETLSRAMSIRTHFTHEFFKQVQLNLSDYCQQRQLTVNIKDTTPIGTKFLADRDVLIQHVFNNIFLNSMKHSPSGGVITLTSQLNKDTMAVSISDQGMGIPEIELKRINSELRHPHAPENFLLCQHHGIGLKLVSALVQAMNGSISLSSRYVSNHPDNPGTTCTICLPAVEN